MYRCVIIEDEPLAAELLREYLQDVPDFELVAHCRDVMSATAILRTEKVDVLFVDVHLPRIKGIDFIRTIQNQYHIILTTAYDNYAVEGFNLNVIDYLLKPIEFSRFLQALQKVKAGSTQDSGQLPIEKPYRYFNVDRKQVRVNIEDILFIESLKEYIRIHTKVTRLITKMAIGVAEQELLSYQFLRVHKSYLINLDQVTAYNTSLVEIQAHEIPIGRSYKEEVLQKLNNSHKNK